MNHTILTPRKALNKAYLKEKVSRSEIEKFKHNLITLLDKIDEKESEENAKNLLVHFLNDTYYRNKYEINTKGRTDLVIHIDKSPKSNVGVLIEVKRPTAQYDIPSQGNINVKAVHELLLYYLRERVDNSNTNIKNLIATNIYEWFVFDANEFYRLFYKNNKIIKQYNEWKSGSKESISTDWFYKYIAQPFLEQFSDEISFTWFNIKDYETQLRNDNEKDDTKLIALYKLLSPAHLLKQPFANDSNTLDKNFYNELLHLLGMEETKEGSKKIIRRKAENRRDPGSLLENTITILDSEDRLHKVNTLSSYGITCEEQFFNIALELCITWMNRILFLKLLESQLLKYHKGNSDYKFLSFSRIGNFDAMNKLFFQILAKKGDKRSATVQEKFANIPYLNSSLFEINALEDDTIRINSLEDDYELDYYSSTVLKDEKGKKRTGKLNTLHYIFEFLDAYDFSSEGSEEIQEENKTLVNASVLGLIFEKINGYKEGSFFTPGFITMYMCRETIRKAVIQKFNDSNTWNCNDLKDLFNKIDDIKEANEVINSLKICDPAVGSGHFLVSALNEIIAIKSELKILTDREGKRLKHYSFTVENDELIIADDDGEIFEYKPGRDESQRIQETIFHEKETIIENCLFGVDINQNSVKICRLRLWIELLKNAYYTDESHYMELETLPNIDINIKCGNSLISRFDLDADLGEALKKSKWDIGVYQVAVQSYRSATGKEQKKDLGKLIADIKSDFRTEISRNDPKLKRLYRLNGELTTLTTQTDLFGQSNKKKDAFNKKVKKLTAEISKLEAKFEEIRNNKIYENAFEWRFEFPEVLDDDGNFVGFDVVIGNPPYMRVQEIQKTQSENKIHYEQIFLNAKSSYDLANLFFERAVNISAKAANNAFIFPHKFFNSASTNVFRDYLTTGRYIDKIAHFGANMIFEDADTYTCIAQFSKFENDGFLFQRFPFKSDIKTKLWDRSKFNLIIYDELTQVSNLYGSNQWVLFDNQFGFQV